MRKILCLSVLILVIGCNLPNREQISRERLAAHRDSVMAGLSDFYSLERDSFTEGEVLDVKPLNRPADIRKDAVWAYFTVKDKTATQFRLVIQNSPRYSVPGTILFAFNIDGTKVVKVYLQSYTKHESIGGSYYLIPSANACELIDSLSDNSVVRMKTSSLGSGYTVRDVPSEQIRDVLKVWHDYLELGGKLEAPDI